MELLISIIVGVLIVEIYAWLPQISSWLIRRAVDRLRAEDKERCREEWNAQLDALPNTVVKLLHAVSFIGSADRINADSFETSFDDIDKMLREISLRHSKHVTKLGSTLMAHDETVMTLKGRVPELLFTLKSASAPILNAQLASSYQHAAETFENFSMTLIAALDRSFELMKPTIEGANAMLNDVDNLIQISFMKRSQAGELLRNRHIPCEPLEKLLKSISDNLETASQMMKSDDWYDHASMKKNKNIIAAIECAVVDVKCKCGLQISG